jgi:hypothetical protein
MKDNAISLEEFWGVITRLSNDAKICLGMIELELSPEEEDEEERAFWRRMYARAVFAVIDGATYRMMYHAYAATERPDVTFSIDELMRLENYYDFDEDKEDPEITFSRTRMLDDLKFAFNVFARVHYSDYILPIQDPNWIHVKEIARIREALQYAREAKELEVYEESVDNLVLGLVWLLQQMVELFESCRKHTEEKFAADEPGEDERVM